MDRGRTIVAAVAIMPGVVLVIDHLTDLVLAFVVCWAPGEIDDGPNSTILRN